MKQLIGRFIFASLYTCLIICTSILGTTIYFLTEEARSSAVPLHTEYKKPTYTPTVVIEGIKDSHVYGTAHGSVRFMIGTDVVEVDSGAFLWPAGPLLVHQVSLTIPTGMQYVASKNGKKYYSVFSKSAQNITPINRVYFSSALEAQKAGYTQ